jgi:hypothetical protein
MLRLAEQLLESGGGGEASKLLTDALESLEAAREELSAFGPECTPEVRACAELADFARRLAATSPLNPAPERGSAAAG